jgi:hypothetical protein
MALRLACLLMLVWFAALAPRTADADVYKWVDDAGNTHFADSPYGVPERYRTRVARIETAPSAPEEAPAEAADPGAAGADGAALDAAGSEDGGAAAFAAGEAGALEEGDAADLAAQLEGAEGPLAALMQQAVSGFGAVGILGILAFVLVAVLIGLSVSAAVLMQACRWAGVDRPGFRRALAVVAVAGFASSLPGMLVGAMGAASGDLGLVVALNGLSLAASLAIQIAVYRSMLAVSFGRAIMVWFLNLVIWIGLTLVLVAAVLLFSFF